jgi:hypothetical protein
VNRIGDAFFVAIKEPRAAVGCSVAIQRAVASRALVNSFPGLALRDQRSATLGGLSEPFEVVSIGWQQ